jgi:hypothetical protein
MKTLRQDAHVRCAPHPSPAQFAGGGMRNWCTHVYFSQQVLLRELKAEVRNSAPEITAGLIIDPGHVFAPLFRHSATRWSVRLNLQLFTG